MAHFRRYPADSVSFGIELFERHHSVEGGQLFERVGRQIENSELREFGHPGQGANLIAVEVQNVETLKRFDSVGALEPGKKIKRDGCDENYSFVFPDNSEPVFAQHKDPKRREGVQTGDSLDFVVVQVEDFEHAE